MFGAWLQAKEQAKRARALQQAAREAFRDHEDIVGASFAYHPSRGKAFKCGPWRWHVYAVTGTVMRRVYRRNYQ